MLERRIESFWDVMRAVDDVDESAPRFPIEGRCNCGEARYRLETSPMFVHCCHCRWCERESGSAFALNAVIEADRVARLDSTPKVTDIPSASGPGQAVARCPSCLVVLWSSYLAIGSIVRFVRVGTLDRPHLLPPDIHVFTSTKQPWITNPGGTPAVAEFYRREEFWSAESLERYASILPSAETCIPGCPDPKAGRNVLDDGRIPVLVMSQWTTCRCLPEGHARSTPPDRYTDQDALRRSGASSARIAPPTMLARFGSTDCPNRRI